MIMYTKRDMLRYLNRYIFLKGQYTLYALFMTIITVIAYLVAGYPILSAVIAESTPGMDPTLASIIEFTPLLIFLFILWGAMWYVAPRYEQPPGGGGYHG